jgi:uncharacterized protein YbbC (DUF1343 family)
MIGRSMTSFCFPLACLISGLCLACSAARGQISASPGIDKPSAIRLQTKLGVEVLFEKHLDLIRGKRVGLITNPTGVDGKLESVVDLFRAHPDVKLVALYGPEHGVRGNLQAGDNVPYYFDEQLRLPVFSLYNQTNKVVALPSPAGAKVEVMVFDLQDAGARTYTYLATMAHAMESCAEGRIPFVVLDRPNPVNGVTMEGPILEYPTFSSTVGLYPIPLRHGMTVGELARLFNDRFLKTKADLTVVTMENWRRDEWYDETGLPWVMSSPNLPTLDTATVYHGQVLLEGTSLSEGRGTTRPFELFGAPWVDGYTLAQKLNELHLPGAKFREAWFTPTFSKFSGKLCGGCQLHVTDRNAYRAVATTLAELAVVKQLYGNKLEFQTSLFDKLAGTAQVREALDRGESEEKIVAGFQAGLDEFRKLREPYLLYH